MFDCSNVKLFITKYNKENSLRRFFRDKESKQHFPAEGEATLSGVIIEGDNETGLARRITRVIEGGSLIK